MYMYAETGEVIPLKCTRINAANILRTGLDNEAYKPPFFPPQLSPLFKLVFHRSGFAQGQQSASPLSATTIHTEMMDFHWTTCEPIPDLQNALRGLNEPAYPFIDSEDWAKSLFLGSDTIVRSPSSLSEPDSWTFKQSLSELLAESPPGSRAQHDDDDDTFTPRSRSDTFLSLNDWASPEHPAVQPLDHKLHCTYHGCTAKPFHTMCDYKTHLKGHATEVVGQWEEEQPCRCPWSGNCKSKAIFKSRRILQTHLENVHITPLVCTVSGCSYRKPFRSNYDLKRHMSTAHSGENNAQFLLCPYLKCDRGPRAFVRKDKWLIHIRTGHDGTECPLNHCKTGKTDGILTHDDLVKHIRHEHGKFECAIGACASQPASRFVESELLKHLELHHGLPYGAINAARSVVKISSDKTVKRTDVSSPWLECKHCEERMLRQKSGEMSVSQMATKSSAMDEFRNQHHTLSLGLLSVSE